MEWKKIFRRIYKLFRVYIICFITSSSVITVQWPPSTSPFTAIHLQTATIEYILNRTFHVVITNSVEMAVVVVLFFIVKDYYNYTVV